ncbi:MAG: hypothetical protein ACE5ID_08210, partial [Acidobacteriota bacterium]
LSLRSEVTSALEMARRDGLIRGSLEARVILASAVDPPGFQAAYHRPWKAFLEGRLEELETVFIVSRVQVSGTVPEGVAKTCQEELEGLTIVIQKEPGSRCPRCYKTAPEMSGKTDSSAVCARCLPRLQEGLDAGAWPGALEEN